MFRNMTLIEYQLPVKPITQLLTAINTKVFQRTTACKIDSKHTQDYKKLFPVCTVEILQVTGSKHEVLSSC